MIGPMIISLVVRPFTIMAPRPLQKVVNEQLHPTGSSSVKDLRQRGVVNELVRETGLLQAVDKYCEGEQPEIRSLRQSSPYQLPFRENVSNFDALPSISQEEAHPSYNDVRQTKRHQPGHQYVVVDVVEGLGEIDEDSSH